MTTSSSNTLTLEELGWLRTLATRLAVGADADDLVQETLLAAWKANPQTSPDRPLRPWLAAVARNRARMNARARLRREQREFERAAAVTPSAALRPDDELARLRALQAVGAALGELPELDRRIIIRRFVDEENATQIGERLGIPAATVRSRLRRSLAQLRATLDERHRGWALALVGPMPWGQGAAAGSIGLGAKLGFTLTLGVGAAIAWSSCDTMKDTDEVASKAAAEARQSPAWATPRPSQRTSDWTSSEADDDPPSETPVATLEDARSPAGGCALAFGDAPGCNFLEPDEETLLEMARCGIARLEAPLAPRPGSSSGIFPNDWIEKAGVSEAEHQRLEQAAAAFMALQRESWTELAIAHGIDRNWAEATIPAVVVSRIAAEFEEDQVAAAVERVARERAGLEHNDEDVPASLEAAVRLRLDTGDAFEVAIAEAVGEARAAELRAVADGWPGAHTYMGNRCDPDPIPSPERRVVPSTTAEAEACVADPKRHNCAFLDPSQLELDRMAECGIVRSNIPYFLHDRSTEPTFGEGWADAAGLTLQEAAVLAEVAEEFRERVYDQLTEMVLEAGKSKEWADQTSFLGMVMALGEASPVSEEEAEAMFRKLAAEKAGQAEAPTDLSGLSLEERFVRIESELGDEFERALAARLGPDRARALRHATDGWPGPRVQSENLCDGTQHQLL